MSRKHTTAGLSKVGRGKYFASNAFNYKLRKYNPQETQNSNVTIKGTIHQEIMKTLQVMQRKILGLKVQMNNNVKEETINTSNKGKRGKRLCHIFTKYWWTHGAWHHTSEKCRFKAEGHKDAATLKNRMGRSNEYCDQATE